MCGFKEKYVVLSKFVQSKTRNRKASGWKVCWSSLLRSVRIHWRYGVGSWPAENCAWKWTNHMRKQLAVRFCVRHSSINARSVSIVGRWLKIWLMRRNSPWCSNSSVGRMSFRRTSCVFLPGGTAMNGLIQVNVRFLITSRSGSRERFPISYSCLTTNSLIVEHSGESSRPQILSYSSSSADGTFFVSTTV